MSTAADKPTPPAAVKAPPAAASFKQTLPGLIRDWSQTLTPKNAPEQKDKGPLAWVRETKVEELIAILAKAGYK